MAVIQTALQPTAMRSSVGLWGWVKQHPLVAYFILAYAGSWIVEAPLLASQRGFGLLTLPDPLLLIIFLFAAYFGPLLAALVVTGATEGRAGVRHLLGRIVQWRVGLQWYLIPILGFPLVFLVAFSLVMGPDPLIAFVQKWQLILTSYLPLLVFGLLFPTLGEEPGWRGFALPRLQIRYGALVGTLILGVLHALWHFPAYFLPGAILPGAFDPTVFIANSLAIIAFTILWTWVFNNALGSILIAIIAHSASNAFSGYVPQLFAFPDDPWAMVKIFGACALAVIILTRGRLSYQQLADAPTAAQPTTSSGVQG